MTKTIITTTMSTTKLMMTMTTTTMTTMTTISTLMTTLMFIYDDKERISFIFASCDQRTYGWTYGRTFGTTDGQTKRLIEMQGRN